MAQEHGTARRTTIQKLGVQPDRRVEVRSDVGVGLRGDVKDALGRGLVRSGDLDGAIVLVESEDDAKEALIAAALGCVTPDACGSSAVTRGMENYLDQMTLVRHAEAPGADRRRVLLDRRGAFRDPFHCARALRAATATSA